MAPNKKQSSKGIKAKMHKDAASMRWHDFDQFWATNIKNGTETTKNACIAHLKATNCWRDQGKWVQGLLHFGIPVEK